MRETTFLPLTVDAAITAQASAVLRKALETNNAALDCWTSLLAGCTQGRDLGPRLRQLSQATSEHVGAHWWAAEGSAHRRKVAGAQSAIEDAIADGDGSEFARAFIGYDHAMASAVVCANTAKHRSPNA